MSQAMYTAMSGINANQLHINVVADNIANLNTTAFKESQMTFKDVWYQTRTTGTAPTGNLGGTNPFQIGVGTTVAAITKNFEANNITMTGKNTDLALEGNGFFTVMDAEGNIFLTRDGSFDVDAEGNFVNSLGYKVMGTNSDYSMKSSEIPVYIPQTLRAGAYAQPSALFANKDLSELNNANISGGTFTITPTNPGGHPGTPIEITISGTGTVQNMVNEINTQLEAAGTAARCQIVDGGFTFVTDGGEGGVVPEKLAFESGTSNFVDETDVSLLPDGTGEYPSATIDYKVDIKQGDNSQQSIVYQGMSVSANGIITAKYSNGDTITIWQDPEDGTNLFKYTTSSNVSIYGPNDVTVDPNVLKVENLQIQCANVRNPEGLVGVGSNLYSQGPDTGDIVYSNGNTHGIGNVRAGGLEASNVDLTRQFSNMIMAQRGIEANSRVFDTANSILQTLVYLGRS